MASTALLACHSFKTIKNEHSKTETLIYSKYILELDKAISIFHFQNYFQRKNGIASIQESYNLSEIDVAYSEELPS